MSALSDADVKTAQFELSGHVYSTGKSSLKGAKVMCGDIETTTLADGAYFLKGLPVGTLELKAWLQGYQLKTKRLIVKDEETQVVDFYLPEASGTAAISGHIYDDARNPITNGTVILVLPIANKYAHLDANGYFAFKNLPADTYTLCTSMPGYEDCKAVVEVAEQEKKTYDFVCKAQNIEEPPWG